MAGPPPASAATPAGPGSPDAAATPGSPDAAPVWFGPPDRRLFGWIHRPGPGDAGRGPGRTRGSAVLCPPLGLEGVTVRRTARVLASRLAGDGVVTVRFDYDGTGDSVGDDRDPERVEAWIASVVAAVRLARSVGPGPLTLVGVRLGATLAAAAAARLGPEERVDGLVLWDPCPSGRSYLRQQQALRSFSLGQQQRDDGAVEAPGVVFRADTVAALRALTIAGPAPVLAARTLVLTRVGRAPQPALRESLGDEDVEWEEITGQEELVDVEPFAARVPEASVERVATWAAGGSGAAPAGDPSAVVPSAATSPGVAPSGSAEVGRTPDGRPVVERAVALGAEGLFGIVGGPEPGTGGPTVVLLNSGVIDHTGPSRLWVELARVWARAGFRVARCDLSGLGDSPARPGQPVDVMYPPEAFDDLEAICRGLCPDDPTDVVLVGLCSGGYHSFEAAMARGARGILAINPIMTAKPSEIATAGDGGAAPVNPRRQATAARRRWARALPAHDLLGGMVDRMPDATWWLINRVAVEHPPARTFGRLVDAGVDTLIVCGEREARVMRRGAHGAFRRLGRRGRFRFEVLPGIDHELFAESARDRVLPILTGHLVGRFAPPVPSRPGGRSALDGRDPADRTGAGAGPPAPGGGS